jgi:hypothetical protein
VNNKDGIGTCQVPPLILKCIAKSVSFDESFSNFIYKGEMKVRFCFRKCRTHSIIFTADAKTAITDFILLQCSPAAETGH